MMSVVLTEIGTQVWCYGNNRLFLFRCNDTVFISEQSVFKFHLINTL